jgi:hypothetical protein
VKRANHSFSFSRVSCDFSAAIGQDSEIEVSPTRLAQTVMQSVSKLLRGMGLEIFGSLALKSEDVQGVLNS